MAKTSKMDSGLFWKTLADSGLLDSDRITKLQSQWESESADSESADSKGATEPASWLVSQKRITDFHADVLLRGHAGPFEFGRYRILKQSIHDGVWLAKDRKTSFPVWLHFCNGSHRSDLKKWDLIEGRAERLASIEHPFLSPVFETVVTRSHRFVASAVPRGTVISKSLPLKTKLQKSQAIELISQVSAAVATLHEHGLVHGCLSFDFIHFDADRGNVNVHVPIEIDESCSMQSDCRGLGQILFRMVTGRQAPSAKAIGKTGRDTFVKSLDARQIAASIGDLIYQGLTFDSDDETIRESFLNKLSSLSDVDLPTTRTIGKTEQRLRRSLDPVLTPKPEFDEAVPDINAEHSSDSNDDDAAVPKIRTAKRQWSVATSLAASLTGFALLLGAFAALASFKKLELPQFASVEDLSDENTEITKDEFDARSDIDPEPDSVEELLKTQSYVQELIDDDQKSLWESPTTGFPIGFDYLPPSPRIISVLRWAEIYQSPSGKLAVESLGPEMNSSIEQMQSEFGFPLTDLESTTISLHTSLAFDYEVFVSAKLLTPIPRNACLANWNQPEPMPGLKDAYQVSSQRAYWISDTDTDGNVVGFVTGPAELVQKVASGEVAVLSGTLRKLASGSDQQRHVSLLLPIISLFNTEGQKLFSNQQTWLNEFRLLLPNAVRGALISLHFGDNDYLEVRFDHTAEFRSVELATVLRDRFELGLEQSADYLDQTEAIAFWEPVRARFGAMLRDLATFQRWDAEFGEVISNAWLPSGAFHNLFAASELAMSFKPGRRWSSEIAKKSDTPQSLSELLQTRRDLKIANPPDLNVLLRDIATEISDQYLDLPFRFVIEIDGADLQSEGITQNQRPGPLEIENLTVAEILTQVMVAANPNRNISGPADPNCKLVWVVVAGSNPEQPKVLITTRAAAKQKGYVLPDAFKIADNQR